MREPTRRRMLGGTAVLAGTLAGCSGLPAGDPDETPTATETDNPTLANAVPTCEDAGIEQVLTIRPQGVTVLATDRDSAQSVAPSLRERVDASDDVVRVVDTEGGAAVEIDEGHITPGDVRVEFADQDGVHSVYAGRSLATVQSMAERTRTELSESVEPGNLTVAVEEGPPPILFVGVSGDAGDSVLGDASSLEFRVATDDGERTLVGAGDIRSANERNRRQHMLRFTLTESGRERFERALREVDALEVPHEISIRAYFRGERIFEGSLRPDLAREIQTGEWEGEFALFVANETEMRDIHAAMTVVSFDVSTELSYRQCE